MSTCNRMLALCLLLAGAGCASQPNLTDLKSQLNSEARRSQIRCASTSLRSIPCESYSGKAAQAYLEDLKRNTAFGATAH